MLFTASDWSFAFKSDIGSLASADATATPASERTQGEHDVGTRTAWHAIGTTAVRRNPSFQGSALPLGHAHLVVRADDPVEQRVEHARPAAGRSAPSAFPSHWITGVTPGPITVTR